MNKKLHTFLLIIFSTVVFTVPSSVFGCDANFAHYSVSNPDSVHFYPTGTGNVSWHWSFGDNTYSTTQAPWHYYTSPGTYYACLTVVTSLGDSCTWCDSVHITNTTVICDASFTHYPSTSNPDSVHFYPTGTGNVSWYWSFGDNTYSTVQNPWHVYAPGNYWACLTVVTTSGDSCTHCDSVHVGNTTVPCNAHFSHYSLTNNPDSVHFYPASTAGVYYHWTFGDNTSSTSQNPWHFYTSPGTYYVCLTVYITTADSCTWCDSVHITGNTVPCNAAFVHYASSNNPDSVYFYPTGSGNVSWYWSFGDNTFSTQQHPWHLYSSSGTYYVCLTVVTSSGDTCTHCDSVHVGSTTNPCNANFAHYSLTNHPDSVHFYPTGTGNVSWYWSFGDNTYSTSQYPWHVYAPGNYYACLTVVTSSGDTCTHCDSVHVASNTVPCNAGFYHYTTSNLDSVHFYPLGTGIVSYYWNFGDSTSSTNHDPWHFYTAPAVYYVCLTVITISGDTCTHCDSVHVGVPIHQHINLNPNPADDYATLVIMDAVNPVDFRIYDMTGRLVFQMGNLSNGTTQISTKYILNGLYYYSAIEGDSRAAAGRLMISH